VIIHEHGSDTKSLRLRVFSRRTEPNFTSHPNYHHHYYHTVIMSTPPPKKARLSPPGVVSAQAAITQSVAAEIAVGITEYVNPMLPAWSGVLKQRYSDFLVNEVDQQGRTVHLLNPKAPHVEGGRVGDKRKETTNAKPVAAAAPKDAAAEVEVGGNRGFLVVRERC